MPYSYIDGVASEGQDVVSAPPYMQKAHINVEINGDVVDQATLVWNTDSQIQLPTPMAEGDNYHVYRTTPADNPVVVFQPGTITHTQLNLQFRQAQYVIQEAYDQALISADSLIDQDFTPSPALALPSPVRLSLEQAVFPLWYGVEPDDGSTDHSVGLQRAINAAATKGIPLDLGFGITYRTKATLNLPSNLHIKGRSTILGDRVAALEEVMLTEPGANNIVLDGVHIRNNAVTGLGRSCLSLGENTMDLYIINGCVFDQDPADGNSTPGDYECAGVRIQEPGVKRVYVDKNKFRYLKYGVLVSDPAGDQTGAYDADDIWVTNNMMDFIASEGVEINLPGAAVSQAGRFYVNNNTIRVPRGVTSITATRDANALGVGGAGAKRLVIHGNNIRSRQQAVHLEDECGEVTVTNNVLTLSGYYAATTLAFVAGTPATITDSASLLLEQGFEAGDIFTVTGSASNNANYEIASLVPGTITLKTGQTLVNEAAGASVVLDGTEGTSTKALFHVPASIGDGVSQLVLSNNVMKGSKERGVSIDYGSTAASKRLVISNNVITRIAAQAILIGGNVENIINITGNVIRYADMGLQIRGNGPGVLVSDNNLSELATGIAFGDNRWGATIGLNPMRNVVTPYTFEASVTMPVRFSEFARSFNGVQPAGTGLYTPWTDTLSLGEFAKGEFIIETRNNGSTGSYNYSAFDILWDGTTLTITQNKTTAVGSHATVQTPQMSGKVLQTRARIVTTSEVTIGFQCYFIGTILQK